MAFTLPSGTILVVESEYLPPLRFDLSGGGGPPSAFIRLLKPKVTVSYNGQTIASVAPAGAPDVPNQWPKVKIGLLVAGGLAVLGLLKLLR